MPSYTTNLNLTKSTVGADTDAWGGHLNGNADTIDGIFASAGNGTSVGLKVGTGKTLDVSSGNVGSAAESDHKIAFLGNSETFHIGIDDSADDLVIGKGLTLGTEPRIQFNGQGAVQIISDAPANGQLILADIGANADQAYFKQDGGTLSILAQQSSSQTGTVIIGGQNNSTSPTYAQFNGSGVTLNGASVTIGTGSLYLTNSSSQGIHLQSPNGTEYKVTVSNAGSLVVTEV